MKKFLLVLGRPTPCFIKDVDKNIHFVGAISPYQHKDLILKANNNLNIISVNNYELECYRLRTRIWELDLTCVVYISEKLRKGQIKGLKVDVEKIFTKLHKLKEKIKQPTKKGKKKAKRT